MNNRLELTSARMGREPVTVLLDVLNTSDSKTIAAVRLGVSLTTLHKYINQYNVIRVTRYELESEKSA